MVAVKEGASELLHLDWNDDEDNMAFFSQLVTMRAVNFALRNWVRK